MLLPVLARVATRVFAPAARFDDNTETLLPVTLRSVPLSDQVTLHEGSLAETLKAVEVAAELATRTVAVEGALETTLHAVSTFTDQLQSTLSRPSFIVEVIVSLPTKRPLGEN